MRNLVESYHPVAPRSKISGADDEVRMVLVTRSSDSSSSLVLSIRCMRYSNKQVNKSNQIRLKNKKQTYLEREINFRRFPALGLVLVDLVLFFFLLLLFVLFNLLFDLLHCCVVIVRGLSGSW